MRIAPAPRLKPLAPPLRLLPPRLRRPRPPRLRPRPRHPLLRRSRLLRRLRLRPLLKRRAPRPRRLLPSQRLLRLLRPLAPRVRVRAPRLPARPAPTSRRVSAVTTVRRRRPIVLNVRLAATTTSTSANARLAPMVRVRRATIAVRARKAIVPRATGLTAIGRRGPVAIVLRVIVRVPAAANRSVTLPWLRAQRPGVLAIVPAARVLRAARLPTLRRPRPKSSAPRAKPPVRAAKLVAPMMMRIPAARPRLRQTRRSAGSRARSNAVKVA